ncbi:phosphatase PAP2 family protein [Tsuneonella sp. YG55]|uniref:Phosphatase PAP2 family protein n=1 Tax=Tsuneonella litorea TaxID=2976475 RepID=A0A9X3A8W7_9SPHN|nr:phosphatase PAP2 family protein [Tsuneonella litorea]MCT2558240.1 phosphatase PAP2 family protein [Tsuneonella litorea]
MAAAAAVIWMTGSRIEIAGFLRFFLLGLALLGLSLWCRRRLPDRRLAHAAAIVGAATWALILCGLVSNVGLRLGAPLADERFARADALVGINAGTVVQSIAAQPLVTSILAAAYNSSGIAVVAVIFLAIARNHIGAAWELVATAILSMQVVAIASLGVPAWGVMRHFGLAGLQGAGLPAGAGVYQWPAFEHFRHGGDQLVRLADMGGVVAFPSFHTVLALMLTQALAGTRMRWLGPPWSAVIILAAIPMGGHYGVDLAAGFLVWLGCAVLARRISSPSA